MMSAVLTAAVVAAVAVPLTWIIIIYNRLIRLRNMAEGAWSDTDVQLKRRHDRIPNLLEVVRAYAAHESSTLLSVVGARRAVRATAGGGGDLQQRGTSEARLTQAIGGLLVQVEAYPALKADQNFRALQGSLSDIEEAIQNARRYYNAVVRDLNTAIQQFPALLFSGALGFVRKSFFEIEAEERANPAVRLG